MSEIIPLPKETGTEICIHDIEIKRTKQQREVLKILGTVDDEDPIRQFWATDAIRDYILDSRWWDDTILSLIQQHRIRVTIKKLDKLWMLKSVTETKKNKRR